MMNMKHIGIYVKNLDEMVRFYRDCFDMKLVVDGQQDSGPMLDQLFNQKAVQIRVSKLITEYGEANGTGDMLELIAYSDENNTVLPEGRKICWQGMAHISFGVKQIEQYVQRVVEMGGRKETDIYAIGKNKCCFLTDCEGNWIALIENP